MLRIVGGVAKGRRIAVPPAGTRPTADRMREAMFSTLASLGALDGARVLDLYAGSGAVGLEALSRGASETLFVESDRKALAVLRANMAALDLPGAGLHAGRVEKVLASPELDFGAPYDLLFADPPYALEAAALCRVLDLARVRLASDAVVVLERATRDPAWIWPGGFAPLFSKRYGEGTLWYARHDANLTPGG
ncbi:MAG: 16S rRNA (guanine(966)-N(2))-methyltransferase RsmD [Sporichthyaceae bacterium]